MTTIGLIGSGNIGATVAQLAVDAGYDVVLSNSRGPETLADLVAALGPQARAATAEDAAEAGELVVVSVPLSALDRVPATPLAGKIVLDTGNYDAERDGPIADLDEDRITTSELLQTRLPDAHVVKAFNTIYYKALAVLSRPAGSGDRTTLPIFGNNSAAMHGATEFLDTIGYDALDSGPLHDSWRAQRDQPAFGRPYMVDGDPEQVVPAGGNTIRAALEAATR